MIMGNVAHKAIEKHWDDRKEAVYYASKHNDKLSLTDYNSIEHFVNTFFDNFAKLLNKDDMVEKYFKLPLEKNVYLVGKFDRISDGVIYDWKTNAKIPTNIDSNVQFIVYYHAYRKLFGKAPTATFFASLSQGVLIPFNYNQHYFDELFGKIVPEIIDNVRAGNFSKDGIFRSGACYRCQYKQDCLDKEDNNGMVSRTFAEK